MPQDGNIQQSLYDFNATVKAKPNLSDKELLQKFPEFNNDTKKLQAAKDYSATLNSGKYKSADEFNHKFPEFFGGETVKKKVGTEPTSKDIPTVSLDAPTGSKNGGVQTSPSTSQSKSTLGRDDKPTSPLAQTVVEGNDKEMQVKAKEQEVKNKNLFSGILSGKKPTTSLVSPENLEANVHDANKRQEITERFYGGNLKEEDLQSYGVKPNMGFDLPKLTNAINTKNKNLATISNLSQTQSIMPALQEWGGVKKDMERLNNQRQNLASRFVTPTPQEYEKIDAQLNDLRDKEAFIKHGIDTVYNHKYTTEYQPQLLQLPALQKYIEKAALDYEGKLKSLNPELKKGSPLGQAHIFDESDQYAIRKIVHDFMSNKNDVIAAAKEHGAGLALGDNIKNTEYKDVENRIIDHIETAIPVQHATRKYNDEVGKKNPALKSFIDGGHAIKDTFSPEKYAQANSLAEAHFNNDVLAANDNFNKGLDASEVGKSVMQKWAAQVDAKMVTPEIAQKNIIRDLQNNKETSVIVKKREADIKNAKDKANDVRKGFLVGALQSANKDISVYPDGSIGIKGMTKTQSQKALQDYYKGLGDVENKTLEEVSKARGRKADEVLADKGTYMASVDQAYKNMMYGLSAFMFAKTGHGGDAARVYDSSLSANNIDLSNVAKEHFEYKGLNSLKSWDYWQHFLGSSTPLIAGATVVGAATGGLGSGAVALGAPEVVGTGLATIGNAGYMTAANLANSYGNLIKQGVNTYDASTATGNIAANDLLFNTFTGYLQSASLFGKSLKPTLGKTASNLTKNIAANTAMMTNQGYLQESAQAEAMGNEKPNLVEYVKKHGVDSFVSALSFLPMDLYHGVQGHLASMKNWNELLNTTNAEIHQNKFYNNNIQHSFKDNSASLLDNLMLMKENKDYATDNKAETKANKTALENAILHAQGLEKNLANAKLDRYNINDLYTAHNLTMADMHDALSKKLAGDTGDNKALADFHKNKSKEYQEEAAKSMNNDASFHYLVDGNDNPVILSEKALKVMTENGDIKKQMKQGYIKEVVKSDDPEFASKYRKQLFEVDQKGEELKTGNEFLDKVVSGTKLEGKKIYSDFDGTIINNKTNELTPFGEEIKQRISNGEDVNIVTHSKDLEGDKEGANLERIATALDIPIEKAQEIVKEGLSPEQKVELARDGVLIDNSTSVLDKAKEVGIEHHDADKFNAGGKEQTPTSETVVPKEESGVAGEDMWKLTQDESFSKYEDKSTDNYDIDGKNTYQRIANNEIKRFQKGESGASIEYDKVVFRDENGTPVGYAKFTKDGIKNIGVLPENKGQGIVTKMIDYLKKEKGIDTVLPNFSREGNAVAHRNEVKKAIADNKYQEAISKGDMTANDAKTIIESAKLEVPKDIIELASKESKQSPTREVDVDKEEGSVGVGGDVLSTKVSEIKPEKTIDVDRNVDRKPTEISKTKEKFKIATPDGTKDVFGQKVSLSGYDGLDLFIHKEEGKNGDFILTEKRTGLEIGRGKTAEEATKKAIATLEWQQAYNKEYPTIYNQVNSNIEKNGSLGNEGNYADMPIPKLSKEQKIKILEDKITETKKEIADSEKEHSKFGSIYKGEFENNFINRIEKRIEELKSEQSLKETPKAETPTTNDALKDVESDNAVKKQIEKFGVPKEDIDATSGVLSQLFKGLKQAGLTVADTVSDWVGIGKGGVEKPYSLKIDGKDVKVKPTSPDVVNGFYSPLEKVITDSKFDKLPAKQWIEKFAKGDEAKWTGLTDWLSKQEGSVSKADIQKYLKNNRIEVVEVVKGDKTSGDGWEKVGTLYKSHNGKYVIEDLGDNEFEVYAGASKIGSFDGLEYAKEKAQEHASDNEEELGNDTKYSSYQLEGDKSNYKEVLITIPEKTDIHDISMELYGKPLKELTSLQVKDVKTVGITRNEPKFESSHFKEPNILAHLRMNTRTDAEGNKVLFLEEVQSDWAQRGKKEGFADEKTLNDLRERYNKEQKQYDDNIKEQEQIIENAHNKRKELGLLSNPSSSELKNFNEGNTARVKEINTEIGNLERALDRVKNSRDFTELNNEINKLSDEKVKIKSEIYKSLSDIIEAERQIEFIARTKRASERERRSYELELKEGKVEKAPFVTDTNAWTKLALKTALKEAVEQGADKISWTTGEQQNERYDLSKQVDKIDVEAVEGQKGLHFVDIKLSNGETENLEVENGVVREGKYEGQRLDSIIGKEYADKVLSTPEGENKVLEGEDLKLGGKGMKGFYGSPKEGSLGIVGNVAKSLFKQEPKTIEFGGGRLDWTFEKGGDRIELVEYTKGKDFTRKGIFFNSEKEANTYIDKQGEQVKNTQHSIDITPELKKQVQEQGQPLFKEADAQYRVESGKNIIEAIKDFNKSKNKARATVALTHEIMHPTVVSIIDGAKEGNEVGVKHTQTIVDEFNKQTPKNKVTVDELIKGNDAFKEGTTSEQYRAVQEFIANAWEKYHTEGAKGFSEPFQKVLDQITKAFQSVYKAIKGKELTPELKGLFDELLGKQTPLEDNVTIDREKQKVTDENKGNKEAYAKGQENDEVVKEVDGGIKTPPPPPPIVPSIGEGESEQPKYTQINKATQLKEVSDLKDKYEAQGVKRWSESLDKGLARVKNRFPHLDLYEGSKQMLFEHLSDVENKRIRMDDEDLAVMLYLKRETELGMAELSDKRFNDEGSLASAAINDEYNKLRNQFENIVKVIKEGGTTLGRSLVFLQAALGYDSDTGLTIRRGELRKAAGRTLTDAELASTARDWEEEKASLIKSQEIEIEKIKKDFDKKLADEIAKQKAVSDKSDKAQGGKVNKTKVGKPIRDKAKLVLEDFADELEQKPKSGNKEGKDNEASLKMSSADAIREIKTGLDKGDKSIPDLIDKAVKGITDGSDKEELKAKIKDKLKQAGIDEEILNELSSIEKSLNEIKEYAKLNGVNDITNEMVGKKLINDYMKAHFPLYSAKDILPQALEELKTVLPNVDENKLRKAYLKKEEFAQKTSKKIKSELQNTQLEFNAITRLENDITDLKELKDIKGKQFESQRERDEYEKGLIAEKESILKDRREKAAQVRKELRDKETEAKRQERVIKELSDRRDKLQQGIREKIEKSPERIDTPEIESLKEQVKTADKELRDKETELRKVKRDIDRKNELLKDYDYQIKRVNESGETLKNKLRKTAKEIDKDLAKKQKELADSLRKKGLKISHADATTRASYETRAASHNQRVDDVIKTFKNRVEEIGDTNDKELKKQKAMLENSIDELNKSKIYLDATTEEPKFKDAEKAMKNALDVFKDAKDYENRLKVKSVLDNYEEDKKKDELTIKLEKTKRKFQSDINESERKLNAEEFDDEPKAREPFTQYDADLIRLENSRRLKQQAFETAKERAASKNKGKNWQFKLAGTLLRGANVAYLIHSWKTLWKVGFSAGIKPQLNALTKLTTGRIFDALPFETTKAISKNAKLGGESNSIETIKRAQQVIFKQYGEEGMLKMVKASKDKFILAESKYVDAKKELDEIPLSKPKEYDAKKAEVDLLRQEYGKAMIEDLGNSVYQFIAGRSLDDFYETFLHRVNKIEREFGQLSEERSDWENQFVSAQSIGHLMGVMGRLHGALKTFSARSEFAAGFIARLEGNIEAGMPIDSNKILEIAYDSYPDWERGKYSEDNAVTRFWNDTLNNISKKYPTVAAALRLDVAITRVPNNMLKELVMEYTAGSVIAVYKINEAYRKAKGEAFDLGFTDKDSEEFKTALRERLNEIPAKEAATIARAFRKGGFGLGMFALASIGSMYFGASFGGFPHLGQTAEDKEKEKRQKRTKELETKTGDIAIGDYTLPKWVSIVVEHTPAFYPAMMALDAGDVYKDKIKRGEISPVAAKEAVVSNVEHLIESSPQLQFGEKVFSDVKTRALPPYKMNDVDEHGQEIKRVTFTPEDYVKYLNPFDNGKELLSDFWYKKATNAVKSSKKLKGEIETNKSLSEEQKKVKNKHIDEVLEKEIKGFYKMNKTHPSGKGFTPAAEQ